jgi:hypothetical protein
MRDGMQTTHHRPTLRPKGLLAVIMTLIGMMFAGFMIVLDTAKGLRSIVIAVSGRRGKSDWLLAPSSTAS